jgi:hypothetical protein
MRQAANLIANGIKGDDRSTMPIRGFQESPLAQH